MGASRKLLVLAATAIALVATGCGGGSTKTVTMSQTVTVTVPPPPPKTLSADANKVHASCRIILVTSAKGDEQIGLNKPFYCKSVKAQRAFALPASPFARRSECRADVNVPTLFKPDGDAPLALGAVAGYFSPKCTRIRLVVYALADEYTGGYGDSDAPSSKPPVIPGEKVFVDLDKDVG